MSQPRFKPEPETPTRRPIEPPGRDLPPTPTPGNPEIQPNRSEPEIAPSRRTAPEIFPEHSPDANPPDEHPTEPPQPLREVPQPNDPVIPPR